MSDDFIVGFVTGLLITFCSLVFGYMFTRWVQDKAKQISSIKFELERYSMMRDDWNEFQYWKREQKEKK